MTTPPVLSDLEKKLIHDSLCGWPTDEHLRRISAGWPIGWFDEAILRAPIVAAPDAMPGIISTLRELRAERLAEKLPFGIDELLRNFSGKTTVRRKTAEA